MIDDIRKIKSYIVEMSPLGKIFLCFAMVSQVLAIGSLAEHIVKFKGFVKAGLDLYVSATQPTVNLFNTVFSFDRSVFDASVWVMIYIFATLRAKPDFVSYRDLYSLVSLYVSLAFMLSLMIISFVFIVIGQRELGNK